MNERSDYIFCVIGNGYDTAMDAKHNAGHDNYNDDNNDNDYDDDHDDENVDNNDDDWIIYADNFICFWFYICKMRYS